MNSMRVFLNDNLSMLFSIYIMIRIFITIKDYTRASETKNNHGKIDYEDLELVTKSELLERINDLENEFLELKKELDKRR